MPGRKVSDVQYALDWLKWKSDNKYVPPSWNSANAKRNWKYHARNNPPKPEALEEAKKVSEHI